MCSISSQELAASASGSNEPGCEPSHSARLSPLPAASSPSTGPTFPATTTCEPLQLNASPQMALPLTLSAEASPVRTSAPLAKEPEWTVPGRDYGLNTPDLLASFDRNTSSWRTSQHCLVEGLTVFSETWPRSGLMQNGIAYQLPPLVRPTDETGSGLWPTPVVPNGGRSVSHVNDWRGRTAYHNGKKVQVNLAQAVKLWPTPRANMGTGAGAGPNLQGGMNLQTAVRFHTPRTSPRSARELDGTSPLGHGGLNPTWVEWLMGFPLGWTDLKDWATRSSRKSRKSSGEQS